MSTLLLRFAAPMQSWGLDKFERRGTERLPTKSAVIGIIAAALGRRRNESIDDLMRLSYAARIDSEGSVMCDFHTSKVEVKNDSYITNRYYLADAMFLVGLEGNETLLVSIDRALRNPVFPLFLGRRSCPPEGQISLGIREKPLIDSMKNEPWLWSEWRQTRYWMHNDKVSLRLVYDAEESDTHAYFMRDYAITFDIIKRRYGFRRVKEAGTIIFQNPNISLPMSSTSHDAMAALKGDV